MKAETRKQVNEQHKEDLWFYLRKNGASYFKLLADIISPRGLSVLDVGCGEALLLKHLPWSFRYVGIDLSDFIINRNRARLPRYFNNFHVTDMYNPKISGQFDVILFAGAFTILSKKEIYGLVKLYAEKFKPKFILIADLKKTDLSLVEKNFEVERKEILNISLIKTRVQVGAPEQINNRKILLIKI